MEEHFLRCDLTISRPMMGRSSADDAEDILQQHRREVGKFVRHVRLQRGMTQRQLGHLLGVGHTAVSNLELGRCMFAPDLFAPLASILDMDRRVWGQVLLRWLNPWIYVLLFGDDSLPNLPLIPRRLYRGGLDNSTGEAPI